MKLPTIPPRLAGKIVKYRLLSEPIRLQDLEVIPPVLALWRYQKAPKAVDLQKKMEGGEGDSKMPQNPTC